MFENIRVEAADTFLIDIEEDQASNLARGPQHIHRQGHLFHERVLQRQAGDSAYTG